MTMKLKCPIYVSRQVKPERLLIAADWYEDHDDYDTARGLRHCGAVKEWPSYWPMDPECYSWFKTWYVLTYLEPIGNKLPGLGPIIFDRLRSGKPHYTSKDCRDYPTCMAAIKDLGQALLSLEHEGKDVLKLTNHHRKRGEWMKG